MNETVKIGLTMGDPSGVGADIIASALPRLKGARICVIGDRYVFERSGAAKGLNFRHQFIDLKNVSKKSFSFGKIRAEYGRASIEYLDAALDLIKKGCIDGLVTAPICKESINLAGFRYSGHTEYFEKKTGKSSVMMLLNDKLKFSLLTRHIPLKDVTGAISKENLEKNILLTFRALKMLFGINDPRVIVCGVNPHASDNGIIGKEENTILKPCLESLKKKGLLVYGPEGADVAIAKSYAGKYDCLVAIYHDQALIPLKLSNPKTGINLTLGLNFIRTSPLHGTAFDIAGKGIADPSSLIAAFRLALNCSKNQNKWSSRKKV